MLAKHALSQLSYGPVTRRRMFHVGFLEPCCRLNSALDEMVGLGRLELPTSRLSSARSNQLSYKPLTTRGRSRRRMRNATRTSKPPLARFRPQRKRNEDGEVPPMELIILANDGP